MAEADSLRMVAEVVDKFSSPLRNLRSSLQGMSKDGGAHTKVLADGLNKVEGAAKSAAQAATSTLNPALATIGVTGLGVTAALAGIQAAVRNFTTNASGLGQLGRDTGIAAQTLRDVQSILGKVGVDAGASASGIQAFSESMRQARAGIGPIMEFLRTQGKTTEGRAYFNRLADDLMRSKDNGEALTKALKGLEGIEDPAGRRVYAEQVLRMGDAARLAEKHRGTIDEQLAKAGKEAGPLTPEMVKNAEAYDKAMSGLASTMKKIGTAIAMEVEGPLARVAVAIKGFLDDERKGTTPAIVTTIRETVAYIEGLDWNQVLRGFGEGFEKIKGEVSSAFSEVRTLLRDLGNKDTSEGIATVFREIGKVATGAATAIRSVALALGALNDAKNFDFAAAGKKLGEIDRLTDMGVGKRSNADSTKPVDPQTEALIGIITGGRPDDAVRAQREAQRLREGAATPAVPAPTPVAPKAPPAAAPGAEIGPRISQIEERMAAVGRQLANFDAMPKDAGNEAAIKRAEELRREMGKLTDELRRLRDAMPDKRTGDANVQKSSVEEGVGPFAGARIQTASFGGPANSMARVGSALSAQRRSGIYLPDDPAAPRYEGNGIPRSGGLPGMGQGPFPGRNFGGGRFGGLGGPPVQPRPGGPAERVGRALRGEPQDGAGNGRLNVRTPEKPGQYRPEYPLSEADLDQRVVNTIAGEVSTKNPEGVDAVVNNMLNRVGAKGWGPSKNLLEVARAPGQYAGYRKAGEAESEFVRSRIRAIASGGVPDNTEGANSYRAESYYRQTRGRGKGFWADRATMGPNVGGNRYAFESGFPNGPYAPYDTSAIRTAKVAPKETADGEGFAARQRAMRSFEREEAGQGPAAFAAAYRARQAEADKQRESFGAGKEGESLMARALRSPLLGSSKVENNGSVVVQVAKPGPDTKVSTSASGNLFRDVKLNRGATMAQASQEN